MGSCISTKTDCKDEHVYANYEHLMLLNGSVSSTKSKTSEEEVKYCKANSKIFDQWSKEEFKRKVAIASKKADLEAQTLDRFISQIYAETIQKKEKCDLLEQNYYDIKATLPATLERFEVPLVMKKKGRSSILGKFIHYSDH